MKIYLLLSRSLWKKVTESIDDETTNESYKVHTKYLFVLISLVVIRDLQGIVIDTGICSSQYCKIINLLSLLIISTVQLTVFFRSLLNPELLYGKQYLTNVLDRQKRTKVKDIWILSANPNILNLQDKKLEKYIVKNLQKYIAIIEENKNYSKLIKNPNYTIKDLSNDLSIQKNHLSFVFKYHCKLSFSSYRKLIQIKEAKKLLASNYLHNNTIEALSAEVGFSSYSPFFTNFKKFTGVNPQEYYTKKHYSNTIVTSDNQEVFPKPYLLSPL
jgi:AraC-like DNA-binding protein